MADVKTIATALIKLEVDASNVKGSMSEAQTLVRQMAQSGAYEVKTLDNAWRLYQLTTKETANSVNVLAEREKYLSEKLAVADDRVKGLTSAYDKFGGKAGDVTAQTHKVALALSEATLNKASLQNELDKTRADKVVALAAEAGKAAAQMQEAALKAAALQREQAQIKADKLKAVREEAEKTSRQFNEIANKAAIMGAAIVGAYVLALKASVQYGAEVNRVSEITGASAETISGLSYVAEQNESSMEAMTTGLKFLARAMAEARDGGKEQVEAFDRLGISTKMLVKGDGNLKNVDEVLLMVADRFKGMTNETEKTALSMKLFGRSGTELIPTMNLGAAGINALLVEAKRLGIVINNETSAAFDKLDDALSKAKTSLKGASITMVQDLVPSVTTAVDAVTNLIAKYQQIPAPVREFTSVVGLAFGGTLMLEAGLLKLAAAIIKVKLLTAAGTLATAGWVGLIAIAAGTIAGLTYVENQRREKLGELGRAQEDVTRATEDEIAAQERLNAVIAAADGPNKEDISNSIEAKTATDNLTEALDRRFRAEAALKGLADPAFNKDEERRLKMRVASPDVTGKYPTIVGGGGTAKVITELDVLEHRLKRSESQYRLYGDAAEYVEERQAELQKQLDIVNQAVDRAASTYRGAASATGAYSEATMKAGEALDVWREKQAAVEKQMKATNDAMQAQVDVGARLAEEYIRMALAKGGLIDADAVNALRSVGMAYTNPNIKGLPPGLAEGGYIPPRPGGTIVRVAEAGEGEYVIPESKMQAGSALDVWREKQDAITKSIESTSRAIAPVGQALDTAESMGSKGDSLKLALRKGIGNYDEQVAIVSNITGKDLSVAQSMLDTQLMERFKQGQLAPKFHEGGMTPREMPILADKDEWHLPNARLQALLNRVAETAAARLSPIGQPHALLAGAGAGGPTVMVDYDRLAAAMTRALAGTRIEGDVTVNVEQGVGKMRQFRLAR